MIVLSGMKIVKSYGIHKVLIDINLVLHKGERLGVVGDNGSGKSTLLSILSGHDEPDSGEVAYSKGATIGYLVQDIPNSAETTTDLTIYDEVVSGRSDLLALESKLRNLEEAMSVTNEQHNQLQVLLDEYAMVSEAYEIGGGHDLESRARMILSGLGFDVESQQKPLNALSGGERTLVGLAKLLVMSPDILLLDEPTNHLDVDAINWLETYLSKYDGSVILVSHDRYFLDRTVTRIIEIANGTSTSFIGNYSAYSEEKRMRYLEQVHDYKEQEKEIVRLTASMNRLYAWAHQVLSRGLKVKADNIKRRIERLDKIPKPTVSKTVEVEFKPLKRSGEVALDVANLSIAVGEGALSHTLFRQVNLNIRYGQHVALIGPNGCGKSTLLKCLVGELPPEVGVTRLGANVSVGYFDQRHMGLDMTKTALADMLDWKTMTPQAARTVLAKFGLTGDKVLKFIGELSGGERGRLQLAKLMVSGCNFLILDEPTNHLDPKTVEVLEDALDAYEGTILFVSHDRYFVNSLSDRIFELTSNGVVEYQGNYDSYLEAKAEREMLEKAKQTVTSAPKKNESSPPKQHLSPKPQPATRSLHDLEEHIAAVEQELKELVEVMSTQEPRDPLVVERYRRYDELQVELTAAMKEWETLAG